MFSLERTYLGFVLYPLQKLFRSPSARGQKFFAPGCNLVDFSSSPPLRLPDRLEVALLLDRMKQGVECSCAEIDLEPVSDLEVDLVSPSGLCLEKAQYDEIEMVLD